MGIPLPRSPKMDEVCWHFDKKSMYTVNSGYQVALKLKYSDITISHIIGRLYGDCIYLKK